MKALQKTAYNHEKEVCSVTFVHMRQFKLLPQVVKILAR